MAGPLFSAADRTHNLKLAAYLTFEGYDCILPQETKLINLKEIAEQCFNSCSSSDIVLANLDGPDADSGTSMEVGIALALHPRPIVIGYRTDFRTAIDKEVGINAMFKLVDHIVYMPSWNIVDYIKQSDEFYRALADSICALIHNTVDIERNK
jgi:nucleoside 2-deoxyribosyltransferase